MWHMIEAASWKIVEIEKNHFFLIAWFEQAILKKNNRCTRDDFRRY